MLFNGPAPSLMNDFDPDFSVKQSLAGNKTISFTFSKKTNFKLVT
jgi:hypothetical protein